MTRLVAGASPLLLTTYLIIKSDPIIKGNCDTVDLWKKILAAKIAWMPMLVGLVLISMATPWVSETVRNRWFALPEIIALLAIPLMTAVSLIAVRKLLDVRAVRGPLCWLPFALLLLVFVLGFLGLAYSIYPYVVLDQLTIWQAASSPEALKVILIGACISVPAIAGYTVFSYRVFRGKTGELKYA